MSTRSLDPNNAADKKIIDSLDETFHVWLSEHKFISRKGVIYKADKLDAEGNPTEKVDPEQFMQLLNAKVGGFAEMVRKLNPSLRVNIKPQGD